MKIKVKPKKAYVATDSGKKWQINTSVPKLSNEAH